ncbi:MAG TPA: helicase, partial [Bacteroidetes bacterium]|nr:helicase [Bacteroidota bacterium]
MKAETTSNIERTINSWLVCLGSEARLDGFAITVDHVSSDLRGVREDDALLIVKEGSSGSEVLAFSRVYRVRRALDKTTLLLDGLLPLDPARSFGDLGILSPVATAAVSRLEWPVFEAALKTACGIEFPRLPVLEGKTPQEQAYIRDLLQSAVVDDLLGPAYGPVEEIIGMSVRDRYLVGKLAPPITQFPDDQVEDLPDATTADPEGDDREA